MIYVCTRLCHLQITAIAKRHNAEILFTPPYHAQLNPIEHGWSVLKRLIHNKRGNKKYNTAQMKEFVESMVRIMETEKNEAVINACICIKQVNTMREN